MTSTTFDYVDDIGLEENYGIHVNFYDDRVGFVVLDEETGEPLDAEIYRYPNGRTNARETVKEGKSAVNTIENELGDVFVPRNEVNPKAL